MNKIVATAAVRVTETDLADARLGPRFGRLDLASQLALVAVESFAASLEKLRRNRIGICLAVRAGSLSTDIEYWKGRNAPGGPSPTLFAYTLPSAAVGEIAIRHRLTGPNLCWIGNDKQLLPEAMGLILRNEADACIVIYSRVISTAAAELANLPKAAIACAALLERGGAGMEIPEDLSPDMDSFCAEVSGRISSL